MPSEGYIYILQNDSFDNLVLKVGLTTKKPEVRAKQLYTTGVPEPFDIVEAYSVGDCVEAEKTIHIRLDTFRITRRREFFKIEPKVAQAIAIDTCIKVNSKLGLPIPTVLKYKNEKASRYIKPIPNIPDDENSSFASTIASLSAAKIAPIGTSKLTEGQVDRINIISMILSDVEDGLEENWVDTFSRDKYPEPEIVIWENIAKVYQQFAAASSRSESEKKIAYNLILASTTLSGKDLEFVIRTCPLSYETIMSIVQSMGNNKFELGVIFQLY